MTLQNSGNYAPRLSIKDTLLANYTAPTGPDVQAIVAFKNYVSLNIKPSSKYDRVVLMTYQSYGSTYGIVNCIPYSSQGGYNTSCEAAIVRIPYIWIPYFTYAHEVGHLFGARHNLSESSDPVCGHGRRFTLGGNDRTIMNTLHLTGPGQNAISSSSRILQFSENGESYNGFSIGSTNENNKIVVQNIICENYNFRSEETETTFRLNGISGENKVRLYPNPASGLINLDISQREVQKIELLNHGGKQLTFDNLTTKDDGIEADVSNLSPGLYYIKFTTSTSKEVLKFIKL